MYYCPILGHIPLQMSDINAFIYIFGQHQQLIIFINLIFCVMFKFIQKMLLIAATVTLENYGFTTGVDTSKWVDMTSAGPILTPSGSDGLASSVLDIGFSFPFGSQTYTQYSVNTDGNLRLGSTVTATGSYTTPFSSSFSNQNNRKHRYRVSRHFRPSCQCSQRGPSVRPLCESFRRLDYLFFY